MYSTRPLITRYATDSSNTPIHVDVSCSPIVNLDDLHVDVSCSPNVIVEPIINVDCSCNPNVIVEPIINVDCSCNPSIALKQNLDAFLRLRVSNPYTLFEYNSIVGKNPLYIDELTIGEGTSIADTTNSYIGMTVTNTGDSVIRQSHESIVYQPGKSKLVLATGVLCTDADVNGVVSRIGTFDASMGYFIERDASGIINVVERTLTGETRIIQANWTDPMNDVNFYKAQIFVFDFEWLGVGQVRCGIIISGELHYYYTFTHANTLIAPYIPTAKLPIRYEISRISGSEPAEMRMICSTVISEGGVSPLGKIFTKGIYDDSVGVRLRSNDVTYHPLIILKLRSTPYHNRTTLKIKGIDIFNLTNALGSWKLLLNPTISGTPTITYTDVDVTRESSAQFWIQTDTTSPPPHSIINEGYVIASNYYNQQANSTFGNTIDELIASYPITTNLLTGTSDIVALCANNYSGSNTTVLFNISWIELV